MARFAKVLIEMDPDEFLIRAPYAYEGEIKGKKKEKVQYMARRIYMTLLKHTDYEKRDCAIVSCILTIASIEDEYDVSLRAIAYHIFKLYFRLEIGEKTEMGYEEKAMKAFLTCPGLTKYLVKY